MDYVNFGRKSTKAEAIASTNKDKIFFPTDDTTIILGGKEYGGGSGEITVPTITEIDIPDVLTYGVHVPCRIEAVPKDTNIDVIPLTENLIVSKKGAGSAIMFDLMADHVETIPSGFPGTLSIRATFGNASVETYKTIKLDEAIYISGYRFIDLGLPSGTLWCERNIGADSPYTYAFTAFQWGETISGNPISDGTISTNGRAYDTSHYAQSRLSASFTPTSGYDAARELLGGPCRVPTNADFAELFKNCNYSFTDDFGVLGVTFRSKINGKTIFFPACGICSADTRDGRGQRGYYWSSSFNSASNAYGLFFYNSNIDPQFYTARYYGLAIRPVI